MKPMISCLEDLTSKVQQVGQIAGRTLFTTSMEALISGTSMMPKPAVGFMYEGARALQSEGAGRQIGVSSEMVFSILLVLEQPVLNMKKDNAPLAHELLDLLRLQIHGTRAPTGHFWAWTLEAPVAVKGTTGIWLQRWSVPVQVTPAKC